MSDEERLKLENELLLTKSKAQMINLYLDKLQELDQYKNNWEELKKAVKQIEKDVCDGITDEYLTTLEMTKIFLDTMKKLEEDK